MSWVCVNLAHHIFGKPDRTMRIDVDSDTDSVKGCAGEVNTMPTARWLIDHPFLHSVDTSPGRWIWPGIGDILTTVGIACEAFVRNALALVDTIGAGMTEAAVHHVPGMQTRTSSQRCVPDKGVEAACGSITIYLGKYLLREL